MQSTQDEDEQKGLDLQFQSTYPLIRDDRPDQPNEVIPETEMSDFVGQKTKMRRKREQEDRIVDVMSSYYHSIIIKIILIFSIFWYYHQMSLKKSSVQYGS